MAKIEEDINQKVDLKMATELATLPWRRVQPQEVLDGEDHDAGRVQAEEHRLVALAARHRLLWPTRHLKRKKKYGLLPTQWQPIILTASGTITYFYRVLQDQRVIWE